MKKVFVLSVFMSVLIACGGIYSANIPDNPIYKRSSPEARTWYKVCSRCHTISQAIPKSCRASYWPKVVDKMQNIKGGNQFTDAQKALILKYLVAGATKA
jgi:hypothetical protein